MISAQNKQETYKEKQYDTCKERSIFTLYHERDYAADAQKSHFSRYPNITGYLRTSGTGFKGVSPESTVSAPVHRLSQLRSKLTAFFGIPV